MRDVGIVVEFAIPAEEFAACGIDNTVRRDSVPAIEKMRVGECVKHDYSSLIPFTVLKLKRCIRIVDRFPLKAFGWGG